MRLYLEIKVDTNDGDYVSERTLIKEKDLENLKPVFKAIKACKASSNWPTQELSSEEDCPEILYKNILTEKQIDIFNNYTPGTEHGFHSIEEIKILHVTKEEKIL